MKIKLAFYEHTSEPLKGRMFCRIVEAHYLPNEDYKADGRDYNYVGSLSVNVPFLQGKHLAPIKRMIIDRRVKP